MLGLKVEGPSLMLGDNMSVLLNTSVPSSMLKKRHHGIAYHRVREAIAAKIVAFRFIESSRNYADLMTKPLPNKAHHELCSGLIYRKPKVYEKISEDILDNSDPVAQPDN